MTSTLSLRFLGHATFSIKLDGVTFLTDPVLTSTVTFLKRHSVSINPSWYRKVDVVLISHGHLDHYHPRSLKKLPKDIFCLVAPGIKKRLERLGFTQVEELAVGKTYRYRSLTITAFPAHHQARFTAFGSLTSESVGFLIKGSKSIYFPGDTDLFPQMKKLKSRRINLCLIPLWGWSIDDRGLHLNPLKAVQALKLIQPRYAIPYHWGTFLPLTFKLFFSRFLLHPASLFTALAKTLPKTKTVVVHPGEVWHYPA